MRQRLALVFGVAVALAANAVPAGTIVKTVTLPAGGGFTFLDPYEGRVGIRTTISFDAPFDYAEYRDEYLFQYDSYAFDDATRTSATEIFFLGNEAQLFNEARFVDGSLVIDGGNTETFAKRYFGPRTILDASFPFGGYEITRTDYVIGFLAIVAEQPVTATFTTITAVPEPATWAMMIGGAALAGSALRRRMVRTAVRFV